jgi:glycerol dehydrogenase-like iron-containing ADH family enzyme
VTVPSAATSALCIPATVVAGRAADAVVGYLAATGARSALLVLDPRARRSHAARLLEASLAAAGIARHVRLVTDPPTLTTAAELAASAAPLASPAPGLAPAASLAAPVDAVVGFGGGTAMDTAKLVAATGAISDAGLGVIDAEGPRGCRLVLVPTTFGTASETSAVALVHEPARRRLARGRALQPDLAVIDPDATADLPADVALSGVAEIVLRALVPRLMARSSIGLADDAALMLARRALAIGRQLEAYGRLEAHERADLAVTSLTTASLSMAGRSIFAYRLWYFATSLSAALDTSKMQAMGLLLSPFLAASADGRLPGADDAAEALSAVGSAAELGATLARWCGEPPARSLTRDALAACARGHWCWPGGPLGEADLRALARWCPSTIKTGGAAAPPEPPANGVPA